MPIEDAEKILKELPVQPGKEEVPLEECLNRVLAQDIISTINMPPFNKSAMDGFALSSKDHGPQYRIIETIAAGDIPQQTVQKGECARIMTGAMLPAGTDRVIKREVVEDKDGFMRILEDETVTNVCYKGEDVSVGDLVLQAGTRIKPQHVAILASMGQARVPVFKRVRVGIVTTGSEIVKPGEPLKDGQIYNSNAYSLAAQVETTGAIVHYGGIVPDDKEDIRSLISRLFQENDMVIISGGVSMGDFDFVPGILADLGVKLYFQKLAIKPGKPTVFGTKGEKKFFGLPGNPVSTFVIFEIFVKPFLYRMMGCECVPPMIKGHMKKAYKRKKTGRTAFIPVIYRDGEVETIEYHGSAHIYSLDKANGLVKVPAGMKEIPAGSILDVRQI